MRRGCISLGEVKCDICQRTIPYPERYLAVDEEDGVEVELGPRAKDFYIVRSGLMEGWEVVTQGNFKIDSALQLLFRALPRSVLGLRVTTGLLVAVGREGARIVAP